MNMGKEREEKSDMEGMETFKKPHLDSNLGI
jgi:hypothetical protein